MIHHEMEDKMSEGKILNKMSDALYYLGERMQAIEFAKKALRVYETTEGPIVRNIRKKLAEWGEQID